MQIMILDANKSNEYGEGKFRNIIIKLKLTLKRGKLNQCNDVIYRGDLLKQRDLT